MFLTRDGSDVTHVQHASAGVVRVSSPASNRDQNSRSFLWRNDAAVSRDQWSCATTQHTGMPIQEGVALRLADSPKGGTRGITVQKNIFGFADWVYNVHLWDTAEPGREGGRSVAHLASHDMSAALRLLWPIHGPRRLCARVVGDVVELKVWSASDAEPEWGDPVHSRTTPLPSGWDYEGRPGLYIGHVPANGVVTFSDLSVGVVDGAPDPEPAEPQLEG